MQIPSHARLFAYLALFGAVLVAGCSQTDSSTPVSQAAPDGMTATATATPATPVGGATTPQAPPSPELPPPGGTPATATATPGATGTATSTEQVASTASVPTSELPLVRFIPRSGDPVELPVEVIPREEFAIGFSGRYEIEGRGMLFYYPELSGGGFWMRNTHVDLDIAFVDADQRVIFITTMQADTLDVHRPDAPYRAAIETPAGWYEEHGITVGAAVEFLFEPLELLAP